MSLGDSTSRLAKVERYRKPRTSGELVCTRKAGARGIRRITMETLGIDIAKATYVVSLRRAGGKRRQKSFPNTPAGKAALLAWLESHADGHVHACLEATGTYGDAVATTLADAGHT